MHVVIFLIVFFAVLSLILFAINHNYKNQD